jgi:hypothetical protein
MKNSKSMIKCSEIDTLPTQKNLPFSKLASDLRTNVVKLKIAKIPSNDQII